MTRDLVFGVRHKCIKSKRNYCLRDLSQVDITGFSSGAYIAAYTCKYLFESIGEKVRLLLGMLIENLIKKIISKTPVKNSFRSIEN